MKNDRAMIKSKYISSMTPQEMLLELLDKALLLLRQAIRFEERKNYERANRALIDLQNIFLQLQALMPGDDPPTVHVREFWDYLADELFLANIHADRQRLIEIQQVMRRLRAHYLHHMGRI